MSRAKLEEFQKKINLSFIPLEARREKYDNATRKFRQSLCDYFFEEGKMTSLTEPATSEELIFDWKKIKPLMESCLVEDEKLINMAKVLQDDNKTTSTSLSAALDKYVLDSGLSITCIKGVYAFKADKPYTPNAQIFMQEFANALTIYRSYLSILEIYLFVFNYEILSQDSFRNCLSNADELAAEVENLSKESKDEIIPFLKKAKSCKKCIKELLDQPRKGMELFQEKTPLQVSSLTIRFHEGARNLEACYQQHRNKSLISWLWVDSPWQILLKDVAKTLFDDQYTYSSVYGTLTIQEDFISMIGSEIMKFYMTTQDIIPQYRIALMAEALEVVDKVILKLRVEAATHGISLQKKIDNSPPPNFFRQYPAFHWAFTSTFEEEEEEEEGEDDDEKNSKLNMDSP